MRRAGHELALVRDKVAELVHPGISTAQLDKVAREMIESIGAKPAFLGYHGYPASICASINEEIVHGIPSRTRCLHEGDIVSLDLGLVHYGFVSDTAVTVPVGKISPELEKLITVTRRALEVGIEAAANAQRVGDISAAIEIFVLAQGLSVVREYTGHGIGRQMHEDPKIPNFGPAGKGMRLRPGMTLAIEPMVNLGVWKTEVMPDGWTVITADRKASAHFEHTIALTEEGAEILTV